MKEENFNKKVIKEIINAVSKLMTIKVAERVVMMGVMAVGEKINE